jgi:hypothetical protein
MKRFSHHSLGEYLVQTYMSTMPHRHIQAFLLGCIQPDMNPGTYIKGSFRYQWLRGHNYHNARNLIQRISQKLENKKQLNCLDFYTLGKLIHYTADAFTACHNSHFSAGLNLHRKYEIQLQNYFLDYLSHSPPIEAKTAHNIMQIITQYHDTYTTLPSHIHTDTVHILSVCSSVMAILFPLQTITYVEY